MSLTWRQLRALLRKDLRIELRTRETIAAMLLFAVVAMLIFQFAVAQRSAEVTLLAGGFAWATIALTAVLGVGRTWVPEREQRVIDGLLVAPVPRLVFLVARTVVLVVYLTAVELVVMPLAVVFFAPDTGLSDLGLVLVSGLVANVGIALVGAFLASMSVFSRARELLLPVLFLPVIVPNVIAAAGAAYAVLGPAPDVADYRGYCLFLGVYAVTFGLVAYAIYDYVLDD